MNKQVWLVVAITFVFFTLRIAQAEDVYNFYFQKGSGPETVIQGAPGNPGQKVVKKKKKKKAEKEVIAESDEEEEDEVVEQFDDNDMPVNRSEYAAKPERIERGEKGRRWTLRAGIGAVGSYQSNEEAIGDPSTSGAGVGYSSGISSFVLGGNYHISRYFDVDGEIHFKDREEAEFSRFTSEVEGSIGIGVTPFHLSLFGKETIRIGAVGGIMSNTEQLYDGYGGSPNTRQHSAMAFIGPRIDLEIYEKLGMQLAVRMNSREKYYNSSLALTYDF